MTTISPDARRRLTLVFLCFFPLVVLAGLSVLPFLVDSVILEEHLYRGRQGSEAMPASLREKGDTLRAGDRVWFHLRAARPLHLYAVGVDVLGREHVLFPSPLDLRSNPLPGERTHTFPAGGDAGSASWIWPDFGERVLVFVYMSEQPIDALEDVTSVLPAADRSERKRTAEEAVNANLLLYRKLRRKSGIFARKFVLLAEG